jgi:hypothetical protein
MTAKQRLRALGYDYDSGDSDTELDVAPIRTWARTKKLTTGSNSGLRRLRLVDDRIDEASDEERGENGTAKSRPELRRKAKMPRRNATNVMSQEGEGDGITNAS